MAASLGTGYAPLLNPGQRSDPLREISRLRFDAFERSIYDFSADELAGIAAHLGKKSPADLRGPRRFAYYHPRLTTAPGFVGFVGGALGIVAGQHHNIVAAVVLGGLGVVAIVVSAVLRFLIRGYATPIEVRTEAFRTHNPGTTVSHRERTDDDAFLRGFGDLPRGDRGRWIENPIQITGDGSTLKACLEVGTYCYEVRHTSTDSKGHTSTHYSTEHIEYLYLPHPADLVGRSCWFRIAPNRMFDKSGDVELSAAFSRQYHVDLDPVSDETRRQATQLISPDVQDRALQYAAAGGYLVVFGPEGVLVRADDLFVRELSDPDYAAERPGRFKRDLARAAFLVHEIYENLDPAYKVEREEKSQMERFVASL